MGLRRRIFPGGLRGFDVDGRCLPCRPRYAGLDAAGGLCLDPAPGHAGRPDPGRLRDDDPNPTMVAGERLLDESTGPPARGIVTLTRHPFLWGTALWALSHLSVRGDLTSIVLMGGILVLSLGGMRHIDRRREAALGSAWGPIAMTTSVLPFAAIASGRARLDWAGIGWWRPLAGLALYAVLLYAHGWLIGVPLDLP